MILLYREIAQLYKTDRQQYEKNAKVVDKKWYLIDIWEYFLLIICFEGTRRDRTLLSFRGIVTCV